MSKIYMLGLLVLIWCGLIGNFYFTTLLGGLVVVLFVYWLTALEHNPQTVTFHPLRFLLLSLHTIKLLFLSSLEVVWEIFFMHHKHKAEIIKLKLHCKHPYQITLLTHIISMTPGTLCLNFSTQDNTLTIHSMFADRHDRIIAEINDQLEPLVMKIFEVKAVKA
ncbi:MAG: hypothetical protein Tsb005_15760 [Gammaproteobacteria bacterium]